MKYSMDGSITDHIMDMKNLFKKIESHCRKVFRALAVAMLLSSLPSSFDMLVTALDARKIEELTMKVVEFCAIEECQRHKNNEPSNTALKSYKPAEDRSGNRCHFCKGKGHFKKDCWKFIKLKSKSENQAY